MARKRKSGDTAERPLISNYGLLWHLNDVFWGRQKKTGTLLGYRDGHAGQKVDFRDQSGIYVLYADYNLVYVGQADGLLVRLRQHRDDDLANRWNRFSWFGLRKVLSTGNLASPKGAFHPERKVTLDHLEALLIYASEPRLNRQGGKFRGAIRYHQYRDEEKLGKTVEEMIKAVHEKLHLTHFGKEG